MNMGSRAHIYSKVPTYPTSVTFFKNLASLSEVGTLLLPTSVPSAHDFGHLRPHAGKYS
jgi:hypothetical protein